MTASQHRYLKMLLAQKFLRAPRAFRSEELSCREAGWIADLSRLPGGGLVPWRELFEEWKTQGRKGKFPRNEVVGFYVTDLGKLALSQSEHDWIQTEVRA